MARSKNKPYSEKTTAEKIEEHKGAIERLTASMQRGGNNQAIYDAIERHQVSLRRLSA